MTGGAGADTFRYRSNNETPWGDTITDFASGVDKIQIGVRDGMSLGDAFNVGGVSGNGAQFYFDAATKALYWDADGVDVASAAIRLVTLTGVTSMQAGDLILV